MTKVAGFYPVTATIAEMASAQSAEDLIQLEPDVIAAAVGDDPDPVFVTIEVINESVSKNGRFYDRETIIDIARQINEKKPDGYKGHLTDAERGHKVPDAETIWLGARVVDSNGIARLIAKGYVLPEARQRRDILKRAKALGRNVAVSIYGTSRVVRDAAKKAMRVFDFDLESIDWTRPGSEGVRNSGIFAVTAEMDNSGKLTNGEDMTIQEALNAASAEDVKAHLRPEVIAEMTSDAIQAHDAEHREVVSEMTQLKEQLGDKPLEVIAEMQEKLTRHELDQELSKVNDKAARKMVERMVVSEMKLDTTLAPADAVAKVLESEDGKAVIAEMTAREPQITPAAINQPAATTHKYISKKGE